MNPKALPFLMILALAKLKGQSAAVVVNDKLLEQVSKNQAARLLSNSSMHRAIEKQRLAYQEINRTMTQIISIQEFLYLQLYELSALIQSGKQLEYFQWYIQEISLRGGELLQLSANQPAQAVLLNGYYTAILTQSFALQQELVSTVLEKQPGLLLNSYDRQLILERLLSRVRTIHGYILYLILRLKSSQSLPFLDQVPALRGYINLDRELVQSILSRYRAEFN